jgi:hypothetical protein
MQIDFFGNNDGGETVYPLTDSKGRSITKYLPFKLIEIKIKVGTNGATYACRGIPYNHSAFSNTIATTPANFEITAKTVQDFFTNDADDAGLQRQSEEKKKQREEVTQVQGNPFLSDANKKVLADPILSSINSPYKTRSYTGAYNAFQQYLKDGQKADHPTTIKFDIDQEIGKSGHHIGYRMDYYDPNTDVKGEEIGIVLKDSDGNFLGSSGLSVADVAFTTHLFTYRYVVNESLSFMLTYELPINEKVF